MKVLKRNRGGWTASVEGHGEVPVQHASNVDWETRRYTERSRDANPSSRWLELITMLKRGGKVLIQIDGPGYRCEGYVGLFSISDASYVNNVLSYQLGKELK
jgi:hypothetical protein